jgi:hypothetical protein
MSRPVRPMQHSGATTHHLQFRNGTPSSDCTRNVAIFFRFPQTRCVRWQRPEVRPAVILREPIYVEPVYVMYEAVIGDL